MLTRRTWLFLVPLLLTGQAKPNFTGIWKLNPAESDFGNHPEAVPDVLLHTIKHTGDSLTFKLDRTQGDRTFSFEAIMKIDGAPWESPDHSRTVSARWDKSTLVLTMKLTRVEQVENWVLSADRKKKSDVTIIRPVGGDEYRLRRVFDKQ